MSNNEVNGTYLVQMWLVLFLAQHEVTNLEHDTDGVEFKEVISDLKTKLQWMLSSV